MDFHSAALLAPDPIPLDSALTAVREAVRQLTIERVALGDAVGRFVSEEVLAAIELPPFTNSAMDGFAVRADDTPAALTVIGESAAGAPFAGAVGPGQAVAISTGAVLPDGADAVVAVEDVETGADNAGPGHPIVTVPLAVSVGSNVRPAGSDTAAGAPILEPGTEIGPAQIAAAASTGLRELPVRRRPRVAIVTTGSELREPGEPLGPGQIHDSNGPMLAAALRSSGAIVERITAAADTASAHREAMSAALEHDVVITTGGVSVGEHDLVRGIGAELGVIERFWRVALRPGKPTWFGTRGETLVFGLPGNPVSALVCFELFVRPALLAQQGASDPGPWFRGGVLAEEIARNPSRDDLVRVRIDGSQLTPLHKQQSHQISAAAYADGVARIPAGEGSLAAGSAVEYLRLLRS